MIAPSPDDVLDCVQFAGSTPEPASVQCHATLTSVLFQPLAFAAGESTGASTGAVVSGVITVPLRSTCAELRLLPVAQSSTCVMITRLTSPATTKLARLPVACPCASPMKPFAGVTPPGFAELTSEIRAPSSAPLMFTLNCEIVVPAGMFTSAWKYVKFKKLQQIWLGMIEPT